MNRIGLLSEGIWVNQVRWRLVKPSTETVKFG